MRRVEPEPARDPDVLRRVVLETALRNDLGTFTHRTFQTVAPGKRYEPGWHLDVLADRIERCLAGEYRWLLISLPPRSLKSVMASVAVPALVLGRDPTQRVICASYDSTLAEKHARDCHAVMRTEWYRGLFPRTRLDRSKNAITEYTTTEGGYRLTTSVGGPLTGRGGNLIIVDDPIKAADAISEPRRDAVNQWFSNTLFSRLDDKNADRIIVVMQRLHVDDLVGHLLENSEAWHHLRLPAIAQEDEQFELRDGCVLGRPMGEPLHPARESLETLQEIRRTIGSYEFSAQYQQEPLPLEGGIISWAWFRTYDRVPQRTTSDVVTVSWDTASKPDEIHDFSVGTVWLRRDDDHYLLHVERARLDYPSLRRRILDLHKRFEADAVLIEDRGSGVQLIQDLRAAGDLYPVAISPESDKVTRMYAQSAKIESRHVLLPVDAPWLDAFRSEILTFPRARHDDQVDSVSQYLGWSRRRSTVVSKGFVVGRLESADAPWEL